jgi:GDP-4-dehydro-6-deoxy-D-mannose reductase
MKVLITGICGFVGGYLYRHLTQAGHTVCGTRIEGEKIPEHLKDIDICVLDLADKEAVGDMLKAYRPDAICHLAAQSSVAFSWKDPALTYKVNVIGTIHMLEWIRTLGLNPRILLVGSSEEYGKVAPDEIPLAEDHPQKPGNPYAASKAGQEMLGRLYADAYGMQIVMVRAFNHTGPGQTPIFVIPDFAKRIAMMEKGLMPKELLVGNLEAIRDFSDVRDIVRGYGMLMEHGRAGEVYNIGSGQGYAIKDLLNELLSMTEEKITVSQDPNRMRPSDVPVLIGDISRIKEHVGWEPEISMDKTLRDVLDYWRLNSKA